MGATMNESWDYGASAEDYTGGARSPSPQRVDSYSTQDTSRQGYRNVRKRPSELNMHAEGERSQSRRPPVQSNPPTSVRKQSSRPLRQQKQQPQQPQQGEPDASQWIHRDKLAEIEIRELEDAGMRPRQPRRSHSTGPGASVRSSSRSMSRNGLRRPMSKENLYEPGGDGGHNSYGKKRVSTIPAADEEDHEYDQRVDSEFRKPEELVIEQPQSRPHTVRPSTSRIPISTASPVPVPSNVVSRDSPLPRSRAGSGAFGSGNWEDLTYAKRMRSGSVGSQVLLDTADGANTPSRPGSSYMTNSPENAHPHSRSPQKARVPTKSTPTSGARGSARKTSTNRPGSSSATKSRERSGTQNVRPGSSAGRPSRPSGTINRPEGDAPWLATMYKPDPRLPQDQQILPTHARRMVEESEQNQREGKTTSVILDGDFDVMNQEFSSKHKPSSHRPTPPDAARLSPPPLQTSPAKEKPSLSPQLSNAPASPRSETASIRPGTSGGYRITPTITTPPALPPPSPALGRQPSPAFKDPTPEPTPRIPDFDEKEEPKQKKGCMGCVVM